MAATLRTGPAVIVAETWRHEGLSPFTSSWFHGALVLVVLITAAGSAVSAVRQIRTTPIPADLRRLWTVLVVVIPIVGPILWVQARPRLVSRRNG